ncbi:MAG: hypothetical protein A2Z57_11595 [Planctomycetes bacterium RIFCSPHIGHO2_12_39_6]|nr:MAG: hypothetical protein A2Z57_11595 [Planctomycetes bacterium RIFCSPHIGHO2_12_39_6]
MTITLTGGDGCLVEGEEVTATINKAGKKFITISSDSKVTNENGEAKFSIKAKKKYGKAKVTFEAGGLTPQKLTVEVRKSKK